MLLTEIKVRWMQVIHHNSTDHSLLVKLNYAKNKKYTATMVNDIINLLDL
jgi:hypothetical protein